MIVRVKLNSKIKEKLKQAFEREKSAKIEIEYENFFGSDVLSLSKSQATDFHKCYLKSRKLKLKLKKKQVVAFMNLNNLLRGEQPRPRILE